MFQNNTFSILWKCWQKYFCRYLRSSVEKFVRILFTKIALIVALGNLFWLTGCGYRYVASPLEPDGKVAISILTDSTVNLYDSESHSVVFDLYELNSATEIQQLSNKIEKFADVEKKLKESKAVDRVTRYTLLPDQFKYFVVEPKSSSNFLLLAFGYYEGDELEKFSRLYELKRYRVISPFRYFYSDKNMSVKLTLGPLAIID